jgi:hypothetical protein
MASAEQGLIPKQTRVEAVGAISDHVIQVGSLMKPMSMASNQRCKSRRQYDCGWKSYNPYRW